VLLTDVLARVRRPEVVLADSHRVLAEGGSVMACVANFGHWYPRSRVLLGAFDYDRRGILDERHVRFFTRRSFEHLASVAGFHIRRREAVGPPVEVLRRGSRRADAPPGRVGDVIQRIDGLGVALRPTVFAYQFLFELTSMDPPIRATR
jgi:hypothetical protein